MTYQLSRVKCLANQSPAVGFFAYTKASAHSNRGVQYACTEYTEILAAHDIQPSMSRVGNPYDNAKAESFLKTLKQEQVNARRYRNLTDARSAIGAFIETVYNRQRLHAALAYRSPDEYEATLGRFQELVNVTV